MKKIILSFRAARRGRHLHRFFWVKQTAADAINNSLINISVRAFPNPFINTITLQLPGTLCTVKITDMAGRVLFTQTTSAATLQAGAQLKAGIYMVQVWQGKEMIYSATVVKQ